VQFKEKEMANDTQFVAKLRFSVDVMEAEDDENKDALEQEFVIRNLNTTELLAASDVFVEFWAEATSNLVEVARKDGLFMDNDASTTSAVQYVAKLNYAVSSQADETVALPGLEQKFAMRFLNDNELLAFDIVVQAAWATAMGKFRALAVEQGMFLDADPV